uniref:Uncharacterized protein n=1 Tax=Anguilla anguilla TaxID=7936 RepID=A0A0E9TSG0_ANGAN
MRKLRCFKNINALFLILHASNVTFSLKEN